MSIVGNAASPTMYGRELPPAAVVAEWIAAFVGEGRARAVLVAVLKAAPGLAELMNARQEQKSLCAVRIQTAWRRHEHWQGGRERARMKLLKRDNKAL